MTLMFSLLPKHVELGSSVKMAHSLKPQEKLELELMGAS